MQYRRCRCGRAERWDTGEIVHPCQGCTSCGTTYAQHPEDHQPLEPHDWKPRYDPDTGEPTRRICRHCYVIERVPAEPKEASDA